MSDQVSTGTLALTTQIFSVHLSNNRLETEAVPSLIQSVYRSLSTAEEVQPPAAPTLSPAVPVKKSVFPDYIVCLEDGKKLKMLKRHSFLGILESGHWGMTTTHARSPRDALDRIRGLIKKHPTGCHLHDTDIMASLRRSIDLVVYCERDGARRIIKEILDVSTEANAAAPGRLVPLAAE